MELLLLMKYCTAGINQDIFIFTSDFISALHTADAASVGVQTSPKFCTYSPNVLAALYNNLLYRDAKTLGRLQYNFVS